MASAAPVLDDTEQDDAPVDSTPLAMKLAHHNGDLTQFFNASELSRIGSDAVRDYEIDLANRADWAEKVEAALKSASQEGARNPKEYPFDKASDVKYPILTQASIEFNAKSYAAICKGYETIQVKVIGSDNGKPAMQQTPQGIVPV